MFRIFMMSVLLLNACAAPTQYYQLPQMNAIVVEKNNNNQRFALRHFEAPSYLDENKLWRQEGVTMVQSALGRWQGVPNEVFKQRLFAELQAQLPSAFVEQYPLRDERKPDFVMDVRIERLLADDKNFVITAHYTLNPSQPSQTFNRSYPLPEVKSQDYDAQLVAAHQSALHDLAADMVAAAHHTP